MVKEKVVQRTKVKVDGFQIFIDAEWGPGNIPISVQVYITHSNGFDQKYIVINTIYQQMLDVSELSLWQSKSGAHIVFYEMGEDSNCIHRLLMDYYLKEYPLEEDCAFYFSGEVYMFYSFQDLGFAFGWNNVEHQLLKEAGSKAKYKIEQKRSITGSLKIDDPHTCRQNKWKIRDLRGWTNTSLNDFASSLGISMVNKGLLDQYKTKMDEAHQSFSSHHSLHPSLTSSRRSLHTIVHIKPSSP